MKKGKNSGIKMVMFTIRLVVKGELSLIPVEYYLEKQAAIERSWEYEKIGAKVSVHEELVNVDIMIK